MDFTLSAENLKVYYFSEFGTIKAVDDVSFKIRKKESIGIVGESGSGKSTLGTALLRSVPYPGQIVNGRIVLEGEEITEISDDEFNKRIRWKKISMIFQGALNSLDPVFTIGSQMKEVLQQHGYSNDYPEVITESLRMVLLEPNIKKKYPHELSGGMKQRIAIAIALLLKPRILIADEPTTSLDVMVQSQIVNLLKKLKKIYDMSIIFISHDLGIISELSDIVGIMYSGQLVEIGKVYDIYKNPKHPYTEKLIRSVPKINNNDNKLDFLSGRPQDLTKTKSGCKFYDRCPYAKEKCRKDPPLIKYGNRFVRCWLYE